MKLLKWGLILGGVILAVGVVVVTVGRSLPVEHSATVSRTVPGSPEEVWRVMTTPGRFPEWREDVESVVVLTPREGLPRWREVGPRGSMTLQVVRRDPPRSMVTEIADEDLPFGGSWTYELQEAPGASTRVTITEEGEVYDPFFRFMSRFVFGHEATMEAYLDELEERMMRRGARLEQDVYPVEAVEVGERT